MLAFLSVFVEKLLLSGGLKVSELQSNQYHSLLTAAEQLFKEPVVLIDCLIELAKSLPGRLIVDDTGSPKYAHLQGLARKMFIPSTGAYCQGFKVVLFLWETGQVRFPIAFALWHAESETLPDLALNGFSLLRNQTSLKPLVTLGDAGYGSQEIVKRLSDYGWPCIFRFKKNQKLSEQPIPQLIPRGYGEITGTLENHTKIKVIRHKKHFLQCNRLSWTRAKIRSCYAKRWHIEEVFRILKSCIHLSGCQQSSMPRQGFYVLLCCVAFACLELVPDLSPYAAKQAVISGQLSPESLLKPELINW